jgi:hypothetical protein
MITALPLRADGGQALLLPAEIWRDGVVPLRPGDRVKVTARVSDDHADAFLDAGARFTLWSGVEVGHGIIYRRVFTDYGPSRPRPPRPGGGPALRPTARAHSRHPGRPPHRENLRAPAHVHDAR